MEQIFRLPAMRLRSPTSHKGSFGNVLIVAGSRGMSGAACLAGSAALHGGAGLVTVATPNCIADVVAGFHPAYMTVALPDEAGRLSVAAVSELDLAVDGKSCVAIGPGLGQSAGVTDLVYHAVEGIDLPMVIDADGLNAFADNPARLAARSVTAPRILTPHPGEFARLLQRTTRDVQAERLALASQFATTNNVVLLLKGHQTLVVDGERFYVNPSGSPALSTGGTGDVLTGLIAALLGQGLEPFEAAQLGVFLHGKAGEIAGARYSEQFVTAVQIVEGLADAWQGYMQVHGKLE